MFQGFNVLSSGIRLRWVLVNMHDFKFKRFEGDQSGWHPWCADISPSALEWAILYII